MRQSMPTQSVIRATGRAYATLFFATFGAGWLLLSAYAFGRFSPATALPVLSIWLGLVACAFLLLRRAKALPRDATPSPQRERDQRLFGIVNAAQWGAIFVTEEILNRTGHQALGIPAIVLIVGLHFFVMPRSYRSLANTVTGIALVAASLLCPLLLTGDRMIAVLTLAAGTILWGSAVQALNTASRLMRAGQSDTGLAAAA